MLTVRIQEKNHSESIMVLKLKDGLPSPFPFSASDFFTSYIYFIIIITIILIKSRSFSVYSKLLHNSFEISTHFFHKSTV